MQNEHAIIDTDLLSTLLSPAALEQLSTEENGRLDDVLDGKVLFVSAAETHLNTMRTSRWPHGLIPHVYTHVGEKLGLSREQLRVLHNKIVIITDRLLPNEFLLRFTLEHLRTTHTGNPGFMVNVDLQRVIGAAPRARELFRLTSETLPLSSALSEIPYRELAEFLVETWLTHPLNTGKTYRHNGRDITLREIRQKVADLLRKERMVLTLGQKLEIKHRKFGRDNDLFTDSFTVI